TGLGLHNAAERLRLIFGERARLNLGEERPGLVVAVARLPRAASSRAAERSRENGVAGGPPRRTGAHSGRRVSSTTNGSLETSCAACSRRARRSRSPARPPTRRRRVSCSRG